MKRLLPPLLSGLFAAAMLYGLLCAAERRVPEPEDPWLEAWVAEGMRAEYRTTSTEPSQHLLYSEGRDLFTAPEYAGTVLRLYLVQNVSVQVVRMPKAGLAPWLKEGRHLEFRLKPTGGMIHACRSGRTAVFVQTISKGIPLLGGLKTPRKDVEAIFDAFEETAKRYP